MHLCLHTHALVLTCTIYISMHLHLCKACIYVYISDAYIYITNTVEGCHSRQMQAINPIDVKVATAFETGTVTIAS